jgi:hypothetical protein
MMDKVIKVTIVDGDMLQGSVVAIDPVTNSMILSKSHIDLHINFLSEFVVHQLGDENGAYNLISPSQIAQIEGDLSAYANPEIEEYGIRSV